MSSNSQIITRNAPRKQSVCLKWLDSISKPFSTSNGVKQGGVLSPVLFSVYIDVLLTRLESRRIGCCIGRAYAGGISYADDVTLISPTKSGLSEMLNIASAFAEEYKLSFNPSKSVFLHYPHTMELQLITCR